MRAHHVYPASTDPSARTVGLTLVALISVSLIGLVALTGLDPMDPLVLALIAILGLTSVADWAMGPARVVLTHEVIRIERRLPWVTTIPLSVVTRVEASDAERLGVRVPVAGWLGFGGLYGLCWTPTLGMASFWVHRRDRFVLIHTLQGTVVISPEPPARFIAAAQSVLKSRTLGRSS